MTAVHPKVPTFSVCWHFLWWGAWARDGGVSGDGAVEAVRGKVGSTLAQAIRLSPVLRADRITYTFFLQKFSLEFFNFHMTLLHICIDRT